MKLTIGENIRNFRKKNDLTQETLADRLGVTYQSISRWENGITYPDLELIPAIAEVLAVTVDELLGMPQIEKEKRAVQTFDELRRECIKQDYDADKIVELLLSATYEEIILTATLHGVRGARGTAERSETLQYFPRYAYLQKLTLNATPCFRTQSKQWRKSRMKSIWKTFWLNIRHPLIVPHTHCCLTGISDSVIRKNSSRSGDISCIRH